MFVGRRCVRSGRATDHDDNIIVNEYIPSSLTDTSPPPGMSRKSEWFDERIIFEPVQHANPPEIAGIGVLEISKIRSRNLIFS
ncbi:hypothetical protein FWK35_00001550 [Aphis craccivora]|uniref:Uncharacterized protein n=1 Tax=Aphis craccivora TaxID=307492 RepID=A0A6G0ZD18_APHCR|nr:hypothetical protein FWK35_00001550 [Aphis craccivora]